MKKNILMITYFFRETDGVGSLRSRTLNDFLEMNNITTSVVNKDSFGSLIKRNTILWGIVVFFRVLFSKEEKVYISCGPFQPLIFVSLASFIVRKKLIIDFRDPWSLNIKSGYNKDVRVSSIKLFFAELIEKMSYRISKEFIVCTKGMLEEYEKLFNNKKKLHLMTNGYDFPPQLKLKEIDLGNLEVVCLGKFAEYDMNKAVDTLFKLIEIAKCKSTLKIHFIGSDKEINLKALEKTGLVENSSFYNRMKYSEALDIAKQCTLGMLIIRNEDIEYGTKIFDYIGLNILILNNFSENKMFKRIFNEFIYNKDESRKNKSNDIDRLDYNRQTIYSKKIHVFK